jgi:hypothetical protein
MVTPSRFSLEDLHAEVAELRSEIAMMHAEIQLARAELDELLSVVRALAADLAERR